jgi:hypothetical protein
MFNFVKTLRKKKFQLKEVVKMKASGNMREEQPIIT